MKKTLTFFLVMLSLTLAVTQIPFVNGQAQSIKVLNYTHYTDSLGYFIIVGEVQNQGPNTIQNIILTGSITDSNNAQTYSYSQVWGKYIIPQQKAPFYMEFSSQAEDGSFLTDISEAKINVHMAEPTAKYQYPDLAIANDQSYIGTNHGKPATSTTPSDGDFGVFWVTGNLKNVGSSIATSITIFGTFFNAKNEPVAVGFSEEIGQISPSQAVPFKLGAFDQNQSVVPDDKKIVTYSLLIQAGGPLLEGNPPIPIITPSPPPISNTTPLPTNNDNENQIDSFLGSTEVYALIAAIIIVLIVSTILLLKRQKKTHHKSKKSSFK